MQPKPSYAALQAELRQRDAELAALRTQLAAAHAATTSTHLGDLPNFVAQMQGLFAGVLTTDPQGRLTWANRHFQVHCGQRLPALLGRPLVSLLSEQPLDEATQALIVTELASRRAFQFDLPNACPGHEGGWLRVRMQPVQHETTTDVMFVGLLEDITTKKRAQLALAESERRYRELAEQVPGVLYRWRKNPDGSFTSLYASPKMSELFGVTPGDPASLYDVIHPDDEVRLYESVALATNEDNPQPWHFEGRFLIPGRPLVWWCGNAALSYRDEHGMVYSGIIQDITQLKLAEEVTRQGQLRQQLALESLGDNTWEFDCLTQTLTYSSQLHPELAYPSTAWPLVSATPAAFTHPVDLEAMLGRWRGYLAGKTPSFSSEHRLRCQDGSYRWVLSRGLITKRDAEGQPLLMTGFNVDITARKQTEAAMLAAALRLSATIGSLQRGILLVDDEQRVVQTNMAFCRIFELDVPPERLVGMTSMEVTLLVQQQFTDPAHMLLMKYEIITRREPRHDYLLTLRNGHILQVAFVPIWQQQTDIGHLWTFEDITERYRAEQALKQQEEKYRNIIDNMQLGLVEMDLNYRVLYANRSYCQLMGYSAEELLQQPLHPLIMSPETKAQLREKLVDRQRGITGSYELEVSTKQGERKWLLVGAAPLFDVNKQPVGTIGINLDITHRKQLEENLREAKQQAEESARAKERFLANMSHEIRTPMNAILGMSQLLAKTPLATRQSNYLHAITTSAQNLLVIINDILDISKLDAGKLTIERVGFNVTRLAEQVAKTLHYKAEEKGLRFVTHVSPLIPDVVIGDPYRITQVLLNLASNSVKFTEKGEVTVECDVAGYYQGQIILSFAVRDTGVGIDPAYLKHIFQEFTQEDDSVTRKFGGSGLGLSISRSLVHLMGCELAIESEKHHGTHSYFYLNLPIGTVQDLPQRKTLAMSSLQELRGRRVLLVEDNEYNRLLAKTFLSNVGLKVTEAEHGAAALERVRAQTFDLILMDVQMPVMDGFETTRHLRGEMDIATPIIALTASALNGEKQKCLAAGMNDYLTKPFFEDELLEMVQEWILRPSGPEAAAPPAPPTSLYNLDILLNTARGNQRFVASMLQTFLDGTTNALRDLNRALAVGNAAGLRATAHKLRPSLVHLQIQPAVALMDQLENWEGDFSYDDLQPVVEASDRLLRQVLAEMHTELKARSAAS
ncbi:MAG: PAS domain S-box protein [Janthinobacterium lividum]